MTYRHGQRRTGKPSPRQLSYLDDLAIKAGYENGSRNHGFRERFGLYEVSPWGRRLRAEAITSAAVSAWIGILRSEIQANEREANTDA